MWKYIALIVAFLLGLRENKELFKKPFGWYKLFIIVLFLLGGVAVFIDQCNQDKKIAPHEAFMIETRVPEIFIPPQYTYNDSSYLFISFGGSVDGYQVASFKEEVDLTPKFVNIDGNNAVFGLKLRLINNRLYVNATFKDIQKEEVVGIVNYDKWSFITNNILDYKKTDTSFEVIDKGNNIVFGIAYIQPNVIVLKGYYLISNYICVFSERMMCFPKPSKKEDALKEISKIQLGVWNAKAVDTAAMKYNLYMAQGGYDSMMKVKKKRAKKKI